MQFGIEFLFHRGVTETHGIACISHEWQVPKDATSFSTIHEKGGRLVNMFLSAHLHVCMLLQRFDGRVNAFDL